MNYREPNELNEYSDLMDGVGIHSAKPKIDPDAEWLDQQQDAAYQTAADAGMFQEQGCLYTGDLKADCGAVPLRDQVKQIHADYVKGPGQRLFADLDRVLGDGKRDDATQAAQCSGWYEARGLN